MKIGGGWTDYGRRNLVKGLCFMGMRTVELYF